MITENINLGSRSYPVHIGNGILKEAGRLTGSFSGESEKLLLVSDTNVLNLHGSGVVSSLEEAGFEVAIAEIVPGEESKNMETLQSVFDRAVDTGMDRKSFFLALGGGVVGDITGFAAATYMRGVPFIQLPTSLLAMVDSSVGGKTAINHPRGKNLMGAFYQPRAVLIDIGTLTTIPQNEYLAGMAEVIKYGIMGDWSFFRWLENNIESLLEKEPDLLIHAVKTSVSNKGRIVESDEKEKGRRRLLNLGHTFGHALEAATAYKYYLHGEAVLLGINMAVQLAERLNFISDSSGDKIKNLLGKITIKAPPPDLKTEKVMEKLIHDKKREGKDMFFILPRENSEAEVYKNPPEKMVSQIIADYLGL